MGANNMSLDKNVVGVVIGVVLVAVVPRLCDGYLCKICPEGYTDLTDCTKIGNCTGDSICYIEVYSDTQGVKKSYTGCRSRQECINEGLLRKRQANLGTLRSGECCEKDFCNIGEPSPRFKDYKECFGCDNVARPEDCETSVLCTNTEQCMTEYRYAGNGRGSFRMGCESKNLCELRDTLIGNFSQRSLPDDAMTHPMARQLAQWRTIKERDWCQQTRNVSDRQFDMCPFVIGTILQYEKYK